MIRLVIELAVLVVLAGLALYVARQFDRTGAAGEPAKLASLHAPKTALWRATHAGTANDCTEVLVVLRDPVTERVWDSRTCVVIANQADDYDKLLYNAMQDARNRAQLLNTLRED